MLDSPTAEGVKRLNKTYLTSLFQRIPFKKVVKHRIYLLGFYGVLFFLLKLLFPLLILLDTNAQKLYLHILTFTYCNNIFTGDRIYLFLKLLLLSLFFAFSHFL